MGREQLWDDLTEEPVEYAGFVATKVWRIWSQGPREVMDKPGWKAFHWLLAALGLLGLAVLARQRRWEALLLATIFVSITAVSALLVASPRRVLVMLPLVAALAGIGAVACRDSLARMESLSRWARTLPERHGRTTLILLAAILAVGFGLRAYRVVEPAGRRPATTPAPTTRSPRPSTRKAATAGQSFRDASDWSPGAPLLYAAVYYATGGAREGTARIVELLLGIGAIVVVYLLGRRINCRPGGPARGLRRRRLPAVHPLDRRAVQRAAGDPHPAGGGARLPLGRETGNACRAWLLPGAAVRPDRADPARVPGGRRRLRRARRDQGRPARGDGSRALPRAALLLAGFLLADRPLDGPQRDRPRPHGADLDRRRQGALRRHLPARRRRVPAGQGASRRALSGARPRARLGGARRGQPDAALRPGRRARYPDLPRDEALGKIGKENLSDVLRRRPVRLRGDDCAQGLADVERRHRRSDEQHRRAGRAGAARPARPGRPGAARGPPALVGAGRDGDPDRARHRRRRRLAGGAAPQRGADDTGLSARRRGPGCGELGPILQALMARTQPSSPPS